MLEPNDFMAPYDDIAVSVVSDPRPNQDVGLPYSNQELVTLVCDTMAWEDFDLFEEHKFPEVFDTGTAQVCMAYAFIAFLRWRVFTSAASLGVGNSAFNIEAAAHSEKWYIFLIERWNTLNSATSPTILRLH